MNETVRMPKSYEGTAWRLIARDLGAASRFVLPPSVDESDLPPLHDTLMKPMGNQPAWIAVSRKGC